MPEDKSLCITGMGAVSSVGLSAAQTCASIRAGIRRFTEHPYHYSRMDPPFSGDPAPLTYAPVPFLDPLTKAPDRILNMAPAPLEDVFKSARITRADLPLFGLFLTAPPAIDRIAPVRPDDLFVGEFFRRAAIHPFNTVRIDRSGSSGFYHALSAARESIHTQACRFALVGGVDSYLDEESIRHFDDRYRLKSDRNRDGFIPGEASAFVIVESAESVKRRNASVLGVIESVHVGNEPQNFIKDQYSSGMGLTEIFRNIISQTKRMPEWVLCDLNGESYRGHEWALVRSRLGDEMKNFKHLWHPAECIGDIRAAGPPLHLILACTAFNRGYAPAESCFIFAGDDQGERGGCLCRA